MIYRRPKKHRQFKSFFLAEFYFSIFFGMTFHTFSMAMLDYQRAIPGQSQLMDRVFPGLLQINPGRANHATGRSHHPWDIVENFSKTENFCQIYWLVVTGTMEFYE